MFFRSEHSRYLVAGLATVLLNTAAYATTSSIPAGAASFDESAKILTIPLLSNGTTHYFNVKVRLDQFAIIDPGTSSQCWLSPPPEGMPEASCFDNYSQMTTALAGTWRGSSQRDGDITLTFRGDQIDGSYNTFYKFVENSSNATTIPTVNKYQKYTQCLFHASEMDHGAILSQILRYQHKTLQCKEGDVQLASPLPNPPLGNPFIDIGSVLLVYMYGGKNQIQRIDIPYTSNGEYQIIQLRRITP